MAPRLAFAYACAVLIGYVGLVHEVVGATLYPDGPAAFGGPVGWHGAGLSCLAAGVLMAAGVLGVRRIPVVPIATVTGAAGGVALVGEALRHGGFHFFAFTLLLAGALVAATWWRSDIPSDAT